MKFILTLLIALPLMASSQSIHFTEVVTVDSSIKQDALYKNGKEWFARAFNNGKFVLQLDDREQGKLIGKGNFKYYGKPFITGTKSDGVVNFTVTIETKDGKYKYMFEDFSHEAYSGTSYGEISEEPKGMFKGPRKSIRKDCVKEMEAIVPDLKKAMVKKGSDW